MIQRIFGLLAALLLSACASSQLMPLPEREQWHDFAVDARFALKTIDQNGAAHSASGRLNWEHRAGRNQVLLANPVGIGLAELSTTPEKAVLRTADGKEFSDTDADLLLADLTGYPLPVSRLPDWLLGRGAANSSIEYDAQERPLQLRDSGWIIDYEYGNTTAGALPERLRARREQDVDLRLRIEQWRPLP